MPLRKLREAFTDGTWYQYLIPAAEALSDWKAIELSNDQVDAIRHGHRIPAESNAEQLARGISEAGELVALLELDQAIPKESLRDSHRVLLSPADVMGTREQVARMVTLGYTGDISFEPFAADVQKIEPGFAGRCADHEHRVPAGLVLSRVLAHVDGDGHDDDDGARDLLEVGGDIQDVQAVLHDADDEGADERARRRFPVLPRGSFPR